MKVYRGWINQPSTAQPLHEMNGKSCVVVDSGGKVVDLYFCTGTVLSMQAPRLSISKGSPATLTY